MFRRITTILLWTKRKLPKHFLHPSSLTVTPGNDRLVAHLPQLQNHGWAQARFQITYFRPPVQERINRLGHFVFA
jgi:hypothetical protein